MLNYNRMGISRQWRIFFVNIKTKDDCISCVCVCLGDYNRARQANPHAALILDAYRKHGHRLAKIDPLGMLIPT